MIYRPTDEQTAIVDAARTGAHLVIEAGAGTGKTTTLKELAKAMPRRGGAYLAYNKSTAKAASGGKFPSSVTVGTTHSFAYRAIGYRYKHRLDAGRVKAIDAARVLGINEPLVLGSDVPRLAPVQVARLAMATVKRFTYSADRHVTRKHMPADLIGFETDAARDALATAIGPYARAAWRDLCDEAGCLGFSADHYLKMWQLSNPVLRYDYVLLDEAQDSNPAVADIVEQQQRAQRILVGDRCQSINAWRGAIDAMADFDGQRFFLSQSFRFGPAIAYEANKWLGLLRAQLRLTGTDRIASRVEACPDPDALLCRSNGAVLAAAIDAIAAGKRVAIVGGGRALAGYARAARQLMDGEPADHPELLTFGSWREVQEYCSQDDAGELATLVRLIDKHTPETVLRIADSLVNEDRAELVLSTAHKSKGGEWTKVRVADDFVEPRPHPQTGEKRLSREAMMLAYVTVTRGIEVLDRGGLAWVDGWITPRPSWEATVARLEREAVTLTDPIVSPVEFTGMPGEQADWDSDLTDPADLPGCCRLHGTGHTGRHWPAPIPVGATA